MYLEWILILLELNTPDQNRNINLRYDDRGNISLRGEYKFAKGGLGYLMGE